MPSQIKKHYSAYFAPLLQGCPLKIAGGFRSVQNSELLTRRYRDSKQTDAFAGSINRFLPQCIMGRFYCKQHGLRSRYLIGNLTNEGIKLIGFLSFFRQKRQESFIYFDRL